jgi:chromosome partitioning protein
MDMFLPDKGLYASQAREMRLARLLEAFEDDYDACLIDAPPSLGIGTECALMAARRRPGKQAGLIVPVEAEDSSIRALRLLLRQLATLRDTMREQVAIVGLVPSRFDMRGGEIVTSMLDAFRGLAEGRPLASVGTPRSVRRWSCCGAARR